MFGDIGDNGYLKIKNEEDRNIVANILFKNGYTVESKRRKRNTKTFEYFVHYEIKNSEVD